MQVQSDFNGETDKVKNTGKEPKKLEQIPTKARRNANTTHDANKPTKQ